MGSRVRSTLLVLAYFAFAGPRQAAAWYNDEINVDIICSEVITLETALVSADIKNFKGGVFIQNCPPPAVSYATLLASRFNITAVNKLILYDMPAEPALQRTHFIGLALSELSIVYHEFILSNYITIQNTSFLEYITCGRLTLSRVHLPPLPQTSRTKVVELWNGRSLGAWGGCSNLREVVLHAWDLELVPERWLAHCSKLTELQIDCTSRQLTSQALGHVLGGATSLLKLKIMNCELRKIDVELVDLVNLQGLDLERIDLWNISAPALPATLTSLDLSFNKLWSSAQVAEVLQRLPALKELTVRGNLELDLCEESVQVDVRPHRPTLQQQQLVLPSIQHLTAQRTATNRLCFGAMRADSLTRLDLSDNYITELKFRDLPVTKAPHLELNILGYDEVREVALERAHYEMLRHKSQQVTVVGVYVKELECDCQYGWLNRAMREGRVVVESARCTDERELASVSPERVQCDKFSCSGGACTCRRAWSDNATVARCDAAGNLSAVPRIPGLRALHAAGNRVRTFSTDDLPDSLLLLDLARNNVSRVDASAAAALFARSNRSVRLARNPLRCDCENRALLAALQEHRAQVEDYDDVVCLDEDGFWHALRDVEMAKLCTKQGEWQSRLTLALEGTAALVGLAALAAALHYRYGRIVAVYIFAHGWCLNCVREEELDSDRPFDAFVSFAHEDYEFVTQHLLPGLESEPHNYRLCVHTRDWVPGEMIPAQIARSIRLSRRTIIVLSRNFLQSVWGLLEFRMAHVSALSERRVRVVVVVLDDVLDAGGLDPELQTYLYSHTYVQWGDAWFWRKLRYALPHRGTCAQATAHADTHVIPVRLPPGIEILTLPEGNERG